MNLVRSRSESTPQDQANPVTGHLLSLPKCLRTALEVDAVDPTLDGLEIGVPPADLLTIQGRDRRSGVGRSA